MRDANRHEQAERMTQNMRRFRTQNFISTSADDLDDDDGSYKGRTLSIKERHKRELEKAERENRENTSALLELRDMEDELSTLLRLFETQEGVVNQLKEIFNNPNLREITKNGQGYLDKAMEYLTEYKQLTGEMVKRVETTKKDVSFKPPPLSLSAFLRSQKLTCSSSTRKCSKWPNVKRRSTKSGGRACKPSSPPRKTSPS